jgi:hypothetical protein
MKFNHIYVIAVLMWGLLSSCISEDYSDCYNRYVVDLSYVGDGKTEIFPSKINKVQMYIFDNEEKCIHQYGLTQEEVSQQRVMLPPLETGDYRIVFLGNTHSTDVKDLSTRGGLEELHFGAEAYWNNAEVSGNDSLYWAAIDQKIEPFVPERQITYNTAHFAASHYDISVDVIGIPSAPKVILTGVSPYTSFNNVATEDAQAEYVLDVSYDGVSKAKATCNILRHLDHENVYLKVLSQGGEELACICFADFLQKNSTYLDCSKHEVLIPFKVEFKSANVEVTLPDWFVVEINPEF